MKKYGTKKGLWFKISRFLKQRKGYVKIPVLHNLSECDKSEEEF